MTIQRQTSVWTKFLEGKFLRRKTKFVNNRFDRSRSRQRTGQLSRNFSRNDTSNSRSRSGSRASTNRDRIRCLRCKEYDHFAKDYPNMKTADSGQPEQLQQLANA